MFDTVIAPPFSIDELVGKTFHGSFRRDPKVVEEETEIIKDDEKKLARYREENDVYNRLHEFTMLFLDYDPKSGLFIAKTEDYFGRAGVVGAINLNLAVKYNIKFLKTYVDDRDIEIRKLTSDEGLLESRGNFRFIQYFGLIERNQIYQGRDKEDKKTVVAKGGYNIFGINRLLSGNWCMQLVDG